MAFLAFFARRWRRRTRTIAAIAGLGLAIAISGCESNLDKTAPPPEAPSPSSSPPAISPGQLAVTFEFASPDTTPATVDRELSILKQRITSEKLTGTTVSVSRDGRGFVVQGPIADKFQLEMLGRAGVLGFRPVLASGAVGSTSTSSSAAPPPDVSASLWQQYAALTCKTAPPPVELPNAQIVACQNGGSQKYVLDTTAVSGTAITAASAAPSESGSWQVNVTLNSQGAAQFAQLTTRLAGTGGQVAITVDGLVYSAPTIQQPITGGEMQITGVFDKATAQSLAAILQNGALPTALTMASVTS